MYNSDYCPLCVVCKTKGLDYGKFTVKLYNQSNQFLEQHECYQDEKIYFNIPLKAEYKIKAESICNKGIVTPGSTSRWLTLDPMTKNSQYFIFQNYCTFFHKRIVHVNFELTDHYYPYLPIEKGVLILWPIIQ